MKKSFVIIAGLTALMTISCNKTEIVSKSSGFGDIQSSGVVTKAIGDKEPTAFVYVETNDVNPLNAMDYYTSTGVPFFEYVCFFASNIHSTDVNNVTQPTLYLNPELTPYICNNGSPVTTYTTAIHNNGQEAILAVLGDWAGIGLSNMNTTQQYQFAYILYCVVTQCGFDGVLFDDEYSGTNTIVSGSYSGIINQFLTLCPDKKVFVFDWGGSNYLSSSDAVLLENVHHGHFGYYLSKSYCRFPGVTDSQWSPISLLLGSTYSSSALSTIESWGGDIVEDGYGQAMFFNLRTKNEVDPLPVLEAFAEGAGWDTPIYCITGGGNRTQPNPVTGGYTITYDMALNCCSE